MARRAAKRRISIDIQQEDARPCIDMEMGQGVGLWVDEVGDEDDPEMPLGTIQCIWTR
jgi:hypothetical protein